jgi:hypothetical protein
LFPFPEDINFIGTLFKPHPAASSRQKTKGKDTKGAKGDDYLIRENLLHLVGIFEYSCLGGKERRRSNHSPGYASAGKTSPSFHTALQNNFLLSCRSYKSI